MKPRMENMGKDQDENRRGDIPEAGADSSQESDPQGSADIETLKAEAQKGRQYYDQLLRTTADFDNYRKRAVRERQDAVKFANEALLEQLIPVLDNFDSALAATNASGASN